MLSNVEKFNYLRSFLEGETLHSIAGLSLTNDHYPEALQFLRYGNKQTNGLSPRVALSLRKFNDDVLANLTNLAFEA